MKYLILFFLAVLGTSCEQLTKNNPFKDIEPTTTDSVIRAKELNDSAITVAQKDLKRYGVYAIEVFDQAIAMNPTYVKPLVNKLGIQIQLRKYDDALATSESLMKLKPNSHQVYLIRGILYRLKNDGINAGAEFDFADKLYVQKGGDSSGAYQPSILTDPALGLLESGRLDSTQRANQEVLLALTWNELKN